MLTFHDYMFVVFPVVLMLLLHAFAGNASVGDFPYMYKD